MGGTTVEERNSAEAHRVDELVDIDLHGDFNSETVCGPDKRNRAIVTHVVFIVPASREEG